MNAKNINGKTVFNIRREFLVGLFLVIVPLLVYGQIGNHPFIDFDDDIYVTRNHHVQAGVTPNSIAWAFSFEDKDKTYWHPVTWLSHMLDCQLYGLRPGMHHLTSLMLHIANGLLLFLVLKQITGTLWRSAFVAALFALHPLNVDSVAWVAERKNILSTFFWMLTLLTYAGYTKRPGVFRYLLTFFIFALGLMAKPMLVTLPFVLLLLDYWPLKRLSFENSRDDNGKHKEPLRSHGKRWLVLRLVLEKGPFLMLSVFAVYFLSSSVRGLGTVASLESVPMKLRIANALVSYIKYIGKTIWPQNLAVFYPYPSGVPIWQAICALMVLICISIVVIWLIKARPYLGVGWMWYLGTLVPVIGLVQVGLWPAMADRFVYVPLIGLFIMIAWGIPELVKSHRYKEKGLALAAVAILLLLTVVSWSQARYWHSSVALFEHTLDLTEDNYVIHNNLGFALAEMNHIPDAIRHYSEALQINPEYEKAHNNIGTAFILQGQLERAIEHFSIALGLNPDFRDAHYNLGLAFEALGNYEGAIYHYTQTLRIDPDYARAHNNLGVILIHEGRIDEAVFHFQEALRIKPDYAGARYNLQKIQKP
jgi:Tfp pilus assembly protein PilF